MAKIEADLLSTNRWERPVWNKAQGDNQKLRNHSEKWNGCNQFNADSEGFIEIDDVFELYALFTTRGRVPDYMSTNPLLKIKILDPRSNMNQNSWNHNFSSIFVNYSLFCSRHLYIYNLWFDSTHPWCSLIRPHYTSSSIAIWN